MTTKKRLSQVDIDALTRALAIAKGLVADVA